MRIMHKVFIFRDQTTQYSTQDSQNTIKPKTATIQSQYQIYSYDHPAHNLIYMFQMTHVTTGELAAKAHAHWASPMTCSLARHPMRVRILCQYTYHCNQCIEGVTTVYISLQTDEKKV